MSSATRLLNIKLNTWTDVARTADKLFGFVFRGQADATWGLSTSLERTMAKFEAWRFSTNIEHWMLHEFKRKHHLYANAQTSPTSKFEWFALMQHYGAPTRLLDFTESFYVALFFATSQATNDSAIWAVNYLHLRRGLHELARLPYQPWHDLKDVANACHIDYLNELLANHREQTTLRYVVPVESTRLSERVARQKGLFLVPTDVGAVKESTTFMQNLLASFGMQTEDEFVFENGAPSDLTGQLHNEVGIIKFDVSKEALGGIHEQLSMMGLSEEFLFPGLDGLARSLVQSCILT